MKRAKAFISRPLDWLLPPLCVRCSEAVSAHQALCSACWKKISFIAPPLCSCCGAPFDVPVEGETLCGACLDATPLYTSARSAIVYDENSKPLVLGFKHGDRLHYVPALAAWMHRAGSDFWASADMIVPVPLHRWRLFKRRYNQAALLAHGLAKLTGKLLCVDALVRARSTPSQGAMNRDERRKNVAGAIRLNSRYRDIVRGKSVVLVDDVLTTGATVNECSRLLFDAGASRVDVLTLMRTKSHQ